MSIQIISATGITKLLTKLKDYMDNLPILSGFRREESNTCPSGGTVIHKLICAESVMDYTNVGGPKFIAETGIGWDRQKNGTLNLYLLAGAGSNAPVPGFIAISAQSIHGGADNLYSCGASGYAWNTVYANTSTITASDRNMKEDISDLSDKYLQMFELLTPMSFRYNDSLSNSGRTHVGFISQDVENAMNHVGLTDLDFAGFCKDEITDENGDPVLDNEGNPTYKYSLRYEEFIAINTAVIQKQQLKINDLEKRIELLEKKLSDMM